MLIVRYLIAAVALLLACHAAYSQEPSPSSEAPSNQPAQPSAPQQRGTDDAPFTIKILPSQDTEAKPKNEEQDWREKAEVDRKLAFETERIADYTFWLSAFTLTLFCAAVGQIVLFWIQLHYMRQGLRDAQITALAARDAAAAQTHEFLATHRPRIRIKHVWFADKIRPECPLVAAAECVNNGTTEATLTEFGIRFLLIEADEFLPFPAPPIPKIDIRFYVACGITYRLPDVSNAITLTKTEYENIRSGTTKLYCIGYLRYLDGAERVRSTGLCRVLTFPERASSEDSGRFRVVPDPDYQYED